MHRDFIMSRKRRLICLVFVLGVLLTAFLVGFVTGQRHQLADMQSTRSAALLLTEASHHLQANYYPPSQLDVEAMMHGAIRGLLAALGDPYTFFREPDERQLESAALQGEFGGIGVLLVVEDALVRIADIYPDSPAERAGLQVGDVVQAVDDTLVNNLTLDEVVLLIRGRVGTSVRLQILTNGQVLQVHAVRARIELPSLSWQLLTDTIGYVRIHSFTGRTGEELTQALDSMRQGRVNALVLDLRGNGGGAVDGATAVLSQLVGHGIAYRECRQGEQERRHPIPFNADAISWPLVVLIDGATASAAEIVAAGIRDYSRGVFIGDPTYGKGSMQGIFELSDGSSIHVTIARWLSASGAPIEDAGIEPDIIVAAAPNDGGEDVAIDEAMQYLDAQRQGTN
jgi:carboxyl-terminal processing protease